MLFRFYAVCYSYFDLSILFMQEDDGKLNKVVNLSQFYMAFDGNTMTYMYIDIYAVNG